MIPPEYHAEIARMPEALRLLVEGELADGNRIVEVSSSFPAPPAGLYVMLERPVRTRARESDAAIAFYRRNSSSYSVEWHDERRFFFVLEPPLPYEPEPEGRPSVAMPAPHEHSSDATPADPPPVASVADALPMTPGSAWHRFVESTNIDYERWREGIGFDLDAIDAATPAERQAIEAMLVPQAADGWREVEALARLATPRAHEALRRALVEGNAEVRAAVVRLAPHLVDEATRTASLVRGLREATFFAGLSEMLEQAAQFHPPEVMKTLFREALHGPGDKAVHLAALLYHIHGVTPTRFDWAHRPFFLRFNTTDSAERWDAFVALCSTVGVDPGRYR